MICGLTPNKNEILPSGNVLEQFVVAIVKAFNLVLIALSTIMQRRILSEKLKATFYHFL